MWLNPELSTGENLLASALVVVLALWMDKWLGEPMRFHPLVGFGNLAQAIEMRCRKLTFLNEIQQGGVAWMVAVVPVVVLSACLMAVFAHTSVSASIIFNTIVLYLTLGGKSLITHAENIFTPLKHGEIEQARVQVSMIVSRNTDKMSEKEIVSAAIESVLENGNDAVFAPMIWFLLLGAPGAILFRLVNTLDAMWGYKNERYLYFGRLTAKTDDVLGWLPARITALVYALQGQFSTAIRCWRRQAKACSSPNGGVVMTTGAGALGVTIGGPAYYHGVLHDKKPMGIGAAADWRVIPLANQLVTRGSFWLGYLWFICLFVGVRLWG